MQTDGRASSRGELRLDSISVVKAALEAKRRAGTLTGVSLPAGSICSIPRKSWRSIEDWSGESITIESKIE